MVTLIELKKHVDDLLAKYPELTNEPVKIVDESGEEDNVMYVGSVGYDSYNKVPNNTILFYVV